MSHIVICIIGITCIYMCVSLSQEHLLNLNFHSHSNTMWLVTQIFLWIISLVVTVECQGGGGGSGGAVTGLGNFITNIKRLLNKID